MVVSPAGRTLDSPLSYGINLSSTRPPSALLARVLSTWMGCPLFMRCRAGSITALDGLNDVSL